MSIEAFEVQRKPIYRAEKPVRDPKFLAFIRKLCCVVCGSYRCIEAAHFGPRGLGTKASDIDALPLCLKCHRTGPKSYHVLGARRFVEVHQLNVAMHQEQVRATWERVKERVA